jgi:Domain of unknown function (DUF4082)/Bacterial Ig-like domain/Bacterial Ig domain
MVVGTLVALPADADIGSCGGGANAIVCENNQPGDDWQQWDVNGAGDPEIQGYATDISVNLGGTIGFKIDTAASSYTVDIYRVGWYGGKGARKMPSPAVNILHQGNQHQELHPCITDQSTGLYDCGAWTLSATWTVPVNAVSGVYVAKLTTDTGKSSQIIFVVRNDASHSDIVVKTSDSTWQAYNLYGGADFYPGGTGPASGGRAYKLSYNRPFTTRGDNSGRDFFFSNEFPMIRFLEANGYDVSYTTDLDTDRYGSLLMNHKVFMSVGHDEYWSGNERANVEAARDAGVSLAFFSGNEVYWKTRWEPSADGTNTANRTLVTYKETWANAKIDPSPEWTGTWRDPRFTPPANGSRPENALTGTAYMSNSDDMAIQVPAEQGKYRIWRNTTVAQQTSGSVTLADHTIGYESDEDLDNGYRPAGLIDMSTTIGATPQELQDFGSLVVPGTTTHHITEYRAASGALVFSAGTIQWAWGLDDDHDGVPNLSDTRMQQATVNILADMGAQPTTLLSTLKPASASTDHLAPTATITSPVAGTTVSSGGTVTVTGTAVDSGGGRVAGVEVSTDGGTTWHPASGTTSWTYTSYAAGVSSETILARATDDSANLQGTPASVTINVKGPYTIFGNRTPVLPDSGDSTSNVELGVRWTPQDDGWVTSIRFYKAATNTGTHTGSLWTSTGTRLATGTFTNETASGWQTLTFAHPVAVTHNTTYVASYNAPNGHYPADAWAFSYRAFSSPPLSANRSLGTATNGVFRYGGGFPTDSYNDTNYFVDVVFVDAVASAPQVFSLTPANGAALVSTGIHPSATFSKSLNPSTISFTLKDGQGTTVAGSVSYDDPSRTVTFTPSSPLALAQSFTATVSATDTNGVPTDAPTTWTFTTDMYDQVVTLFDNATTPANPSVSDGAAVTLGVRFTPSASGKIIGIRYYQGPGVTGTHTGSLWSGGGTRLATVTFPAGGVGWQEARFTTPVDVTAGSNYVASYYAPNGGYAADGNFFTSRYTNGPLSAPAGANGVYAYGGDAYPTGSYHSTNYYVDVLFVPSDQAPPPPPTTKSLFSNDSVPTNEDWADDSAVTVGVQFHSDVSGNVTGIKFYKGMANTGTHVGALWSGTGQLLASGTFTNEDSWGWVSMTFTTPVHITAGTTYVASYFAPVGEYATDGNAFATGYDNGVLHVAAGGGAYRYGSSSSFPDSSSNTNYWVDLILQPDS